MKKERKTATVKRKKAIEKAEKEIKKLSLDEIEAEMDKLAMTTDMAKVFQCSQRMEMLEKVANFKIKRMQLDIVKQETNKTPQAIKVEFTSSDNATQNDRIEKLEESVKNARGIKNDA